MMFGYFALLNFLLYLVNCELVEEDSSDGGDFGASLMATLKNNKRDKDESVDEEYEDLRAEFLAYRTALDSLNANRRSMTTTACWSLGGICVNYKLCTGFTYLTEVPGCKSKLMVCCFAWNQFKVKDWRSKGLGTPTFPWSQKTKFGGHGVLIKNPNKGLEEFVEHNGLRNSDGTKALAVILSPDE